MELSETLENVVDGLKDSFGDSFNEIEQYRGDTIVRVQPDPIVDICRYLKEEHRFIYLIDLFGTDRFTTEDRFEVVYNLISLRDRVRLFLKTRLPEDFDYHPLRKEFPLLGVPGSIELPSSTPDPEE